ncbi:MAG: MBL fold metallo-hydrolase [Proteobacteria bacterium]|nr:MBL fold metallo-hydrolase [Pseudomonadota bacterium]
MNPIIIHPGIYRITLPLFGKKPGPVNIYLFKGKDTLTLLDTGTRLSAKVLVKALGKIGLGFKDIDRIVLTHGHVDHYGAASAIIAENSNKTVVHAHPSDIQAIETGADASISSYRHFLKLTGTPQAVQLGILPMFLWLRRMTRPCPVDAPLRNNQSLMFGDYPGRIIETPGHTRGSVCIFLEKEGILFSGDHILGHITPNALPMLEKGHRLPIRISQKEFFESLRIVEALNPKIVYPAHGKPIRTFSRTHQMYINSFEKRQQSIFEIIQNNPGKSIYAMARDHFSNLSGPRFFLDLYLAISEIYTHIQMLEELGRVRATTTNNLLTVECIS